MKVRVEPLAIPLSLRVVSTREMTGRREPPSLWRTGVKYINGYDDPEIVAGAGTIGTHNPIHLRGRRKAVGLLADDVWDLPPFHLAGIELLEQIAEADAVIVPVGGAGG